MKIFCGNAGGFESTGTLFSFSTNIPVPSGLAVGLLSDTEIQINWDADSWAEWHRVEYTATGAGGKRDATPTVFDSHLVGSNVTITGLTAGSTYDFHIYAGRGASYYEPHGTTITSQTLASNGNLNGALPIGAIIGIVLGIVAAVLVVTLIFGMFVMRQNRRTKQLLNVLDQELVSHHLICSCLMFCLFFFCVGSRTNILFFLLFIRLSAKAVLSNLAHLDDPNRVFLFLFFFFFSDSILSRSLFPPFFCCCGGHPSQH